MPGVENHFGTVTGHHSCHGKGKHAQASKEIFRCRAGPSTAPDVPTQPNKPRAALESDPE